MSKGAPMICSQNQMFKQNFIHILFYLISMVYKNHAKEEGGREIELDSCTALLIYLLETFPTDMVATLVPVIWSYCKFNLQKAKTSYLKSMTIQLLSIMFWKFPVEFLERLMAENTFEGTMAFFLKNAKRA